MIAFSIWLSSTLVILCYAAKLSIYIAGSPVHVPMNEEVLCEAPSSLECHDCTHMRVCDTKRKIAIIKKCSAAAPYCNKNKCSEIPDQNECKDNVLCPKPNIFVPNPSNCKEYFYCDNMRMAIQYKCPEKYVYDAKTAFCKAVSPYHTCIEIDCNLPANKFQLIGYPGDTSIYAYCDNNRTITFMCDEDEQFEKESLSCEFACIKEGYFAYKNDCRKYNACFLNSNNTFSKIVAECPPGMLFDRKIRACDIEFKQCPSTNDDITTTEIYTTPDAIYESHSMEPETLYEDIGTFTSAMLPDYMNRQMSSLTNQDTKAETEDEEEPRLA